MSKKIAGEGSGTAEWCTNLANEKGQILQCIFTCEESVDKLKPLADGVMGRYERADVESPTLMYVDRGCCRLQGHTHVEALFDRWIEDGMVIRLDIFHWIHRFDSAVRTESHSKYAVFKSAISGAVFAYNKDDLGIKFVKLINKTFDKVGKETHFNFYILDA